jgi:hypothetical protein
MLVNLFKSIQSFLERLKILNEISLSTEMKGSLGRTLAQVLSILALSTKEMSQSRLGAPIHWYVYLCR